uniref:SUEL-type lectin domain-containing protein n=1 Tax=Periophthalmus magnuspinnatus TaxID=409849 RepID=A0A3B4BG30_9GOBI
SLVLTKIVITLIAIKCLSNLNTVDYVVDTDRGVIAVQAALYGRQDRETCSYGWIMDHPSDTNCFQEGTKEVLQKRCDGRSTCEVPLYYSKREICSGRLRKPRLSICTISPSDHQHTLTHSLKAKASTSVFGDPCVGIYKHLEVKCTAAAVCF